MIPDIFVDMIFSVLLSKNKIIKNNQLFRDIIEIIEFVQKNSNIDIPIKSKLKVEALKKICEMKIKGHTDEVIVDNLCGVGSKFSDMKDFIEDKMERILPDKVASDYVEQIRLRKKMSKLFSNYDKVHGFIERINNESFDSLEDAVTQYETQVKELYLNLMEQNRVASIEASASFDLNKDNFMNVQEQILKNYSQRNSIPSGFSILDQDYLRGGFEPQRLYVFGGSSGVGKSVTLTNFLINAATSDKFKKKKTSNKDNVFIYVTLENLLDETFVRTYCCLFEKTTDEVIEDINKGINLGDSIKHKFNESGCNCLFFYFPAATISPADLMTTVDDIVGEYGRDNIKGLIVDYLDLLRGDHKAEYYRLELGYISLALKVIAVEYNIPVITATQVNRAGYKSGDPITADKISESIKKVEHADFVGMIRRDTSKNDIMHLDIAKNRSGPSQRTVKFKIDYKKYKIYPYQLRASDIDIDNAETKINVPGEGANILDI